MGVQQAYGGSAKAPVIICENTTLTTAYTNLAPKHAGLIITSVTFNVAYEAYVDGLEMRLCQRLPSGDACAGWVENRGQTVDLDTFNGNEAMHGFYLQVQVRKMPVSSRDICSPILAPGSNYSSLSVNYEYVA